MNSTLHNQDKRFLELLQKWQSGDFTRADEVEMNSLASSDPFRQEALEGFMEHLENDHARALSTLHNRIRGKQRRRRIAFPQLLAVAAGLVLVFGAIWFFNIRPVPQGQEKMAIELPAPPDSQKEMTPPAAAKPDLVISRPAPPAQSGPAATQPASAPEKAKDIAYTEKSKQLDSYQGVDDKLSDVQEAEVAVEERKKVDSYQQPNAKMERTTNAPLPYERAKESAGSAMKKSKAPARASSEDKSSGAASTKSTVSTAQPAEGWEKFRVYLINNARLTPAALANNVTGNVRVQFVVDNKNQPLDFQVIQKLGFGCDEAAIQLIKNAAWLRGNGQPVVVDVSFVR